MRSTNLIRLRQRRRDKSRNSGPMRILRVLVILGVFAGAFRLDAAEAVCAGTGVGGGARVSTQ